MLPPFPYTGGFMKMIDLSPDFEAEYFQCLEEWSEDMKDSGEQRKIWYQQMLHKGLRVKLAITDEGIVGGFIQYLPIRHSILKGEDGYFIYCIWVHGHKAGRGDMRKKGLGKALLLAAEEDVKALGGKGLAAWGLILPIWMKASWFKKHGYRTVDRDGISALVWKPFSIDAVAPKWRRQLRKPEIIAGKLRISLFSHGWCAAQNIAAERIKRIASELGDKVILDEYDTRNRIVLDSWGLSDAIFLNQKRINTGPPPSYEKLKKTVLKQLK